MWFRGIRRRAGPLRDWLRGLPPGEVERLGPAPAATGPRVETWVIASWNVHYGYGPTLDRGSVCTRTEVLGNLEAVAAFLREQDVDVAALQEVDRGGTRARGIDQFAWLRRATGLSWAVWTPTWVVPWVPSPGADPRRHWGRTRSGQCILSRFPLVAPARHALPPVAAHGPLYRRFYLHRADLEATVLLPGGQRVVVHDVHTEAFDRQSNTAHARVLAELLGPAPRGLVLAGDLNSVPPEAARKHGFPDEPETDMRGDRAIETLRAVPGLREVAPPGEEPAWHTFPAWAPNRRLDYLFYAEDLVLERAWVGRPAPPASDHLPVLARFRVSAEG